MRSEGSQNEDAVREAREKEEDARLEAEALRRRYVENKLLHVYSSVVSYLRLDSFGYFKVIRS